MAALSSILIGAATVGSVGLGIKQYKEAKSARNEQQAAIEQQTLEAKEAANLRGTEVDPGAKFKLGATENTTSTTAVSSEKGRGKRKAKSALGGVSASRIGGL